MGWEVNKLRAGKPILYITRMNKMKSKAKFYLRIL